MRLSVLCFSSPREPHSPRMGFSSLRPLVFPAKIQLMALPENAEKITEDIYRDPSGKIWLRAPKRPFPWWEPINAPDAFGRTTVLISLWLLQAVTIFYTDLIRSPFTQAFPAYIRIIIFGIGAALPFLPFWIGFALLLRREDIWGYYVTGAFFVFMFGITLSFSLPFNLMRWDSSGHEFFLILPGITGVILICYPLYAFWRKAQASYYFLFTKYESVRKNIFHATRRFGIVLIGAGILLPLFGLWLQLPVSGKDNTPWFWRSVGYSVLAGGVLCGMPLIVGGFFFMRGKNWARNLVRFFGIPVYCLAVAVFYVMSKPDIKGLAVFSLVFGVLIIGYVFFEFYRFMSSNKARSYCGVGEYIPPWDKQLAAAGLSVPEAEEKE